MAASKEFFQAQLSDLIRSLNEQGLLDSQFVAAQVVKQTHGSFAFLELISKFRAGSKSTMRIMRLQLEQPIVNYHDMNIYCMQMKGGATSIGAHRVSLASGDLWRAISNKSIPDCILALNRMKTEFEVLEEKLEIISQLERKIIGFDFD